MLSSEKSIWIQINDFIFISPLIVDTFATWDVRMIAGWLSRKSQQGWWIRRSGMWCAGHFRSKRLETKGLRSECTPVCLMVVKKDHAWCFLKNVLLVLVVQSWNRNVRTWTGREEDLQIVTSSYDVVWNMNFSITSTIEWQYCLVSVYYNRALVIWTSVLPPQ